MLHSWHVPPSDPVRDEDDEVLAEVIWSQVERVDSRVLGGGGVYAPERQEVRTAANRAWALRRELGLGPFVNTVGHEKSKPQFLLLFARADHQVVLKAYGRSRPSEAAIQRIWRREGIAVVDVLASGDHPTSWLLMSPLNLESLSLSSASSALTAKITSQLADQLMVAHRVGRRFLDASGDTTTWFPLTQVIEHHLGAVLKPLNDHGYAVPSGWRSLVRSLCHSVKPSILHGDLGGGNVMLNRDGHGLILLDACGYLGPPEFDAARWAARHGGATRAVDLLDIWLLKDSELHRPLALGLLGLELLMESGVREIVKEEQSRDASQQDPVTDSLLKKALELLRIA